MRDIVVRGVQGSSPEVVDLASSVFRHHSTLADVLRWCSAQRPPVLVKEIVTQDEYTHDVVIPFGPAAWLAFDTT